MKAKGIINWCVMLLWIVATYHCAFEQLISGHRHTPTSQTATTLPDSSSRSDCPSHTSGDPSSHSEGKACGPVLQSTSSNQSQDAAQVALVPIVGAILATLSSGMSDSTPILSTVSFKNANSAGLSQRANSLSIAPNAPPVMLA